MNGQRIEIGSVFGTYTVVGTHIDHKNKTNYILRCTCGNECKKIGYNVRLNLKCQKCGVNKLIGTKYEKSIILKHIKGSKFECLCDCGKIFIGRARSKSCGCHIEEMHIENAKKLEGITINNFKILKFSHFKNRAGKGRHAVYKTKCKCGKVFLTHASPLSRNKSCGCRKFSNYSKGQYQGSAIYSEKQIRSCIDLHLSGNYALEEISSMTGVAFHTLKDIISNRSWKHIKVSDDIIKSSPMKSKFRNPRRRIQILPNQQFNSWTTIQKSLSRNRQAYWLCKCKCGKESEVPASSLIRGESKQCANCAFIYFVKRQYLI